MKPNRMGRNHGHRKALMRNLATSLILNDRIKTTDVKAKALRSVAEKMITLGKQGDLAARRRAAAYLNHPDAVKRLFEDIAPRYKDRDGGYTRILKVGVRRGDAAPISLIEWV